MKKRETKKHTACYVELCACHICRRIMRDAETARLIVKHEIVVTPPYKGHPMWSAWTRKDSGFNRARTLHAAVRKAAKGTK